MTLHLPDPSRQASTSKPNQALCIIPLEINAHIASFLDDIDIAHFASTCRATHNAVHCDRSPLWRAKYLKFYDLVPGRSNNDLKDIYQARRKALRVGLHFHKGTTKGEQVALSMLRDLIVESFSSSQAGDQSSRKSTSQNLQTLRDFAIQSDILTHVMQQRIVSLQHPLLITIQIMLANIRFEPLMHSRALGYYDAQKAMYASPADQPLFLGVHKAEVNISWVANAIEFFKHHMGSLENEELSSAYEGLGTHERIRAWRQPLRNGSRPLGKIWKGVYAYLNLGEMFKVRERQKEDEHWIMDRFNDTHDGSPFQELHLDYAQTLTPEIWPRCFEKHLNALTHPSANCILEGECDSPVDRRSRPTRAQHRARKSNDAPHRTTVNNLKDATPTSFSFKGSGHDTEKFFAAGWMNPLPTQQGIPGWQRWTMMKFFVNGEHETNGRFSDPFTMQGPLGSSLNPFDHMDEESLWAYEGVVIPGGEIVVGRWWSPTSIEGNDEEDYWDEVYSGPFMFWCVDENDTQH